MLDDQSGQLARVPCVKGWTEIPVRFMDKSFIRIQGICVCIGVPLDIGFAVGKQLAAGVRAWRYVN